MLFRRQFLLGPRLFNPTGNWNVNQLSRGLLLSTHPDLEVAIDSLNGITVGIIGIVVDPLYPDYSMQDLVKSIICTSTGILDVINSTHSFTGRWIVIFQASNETFLFTDPSGFRQVYYIQRNNEIWCGSQPEILKGVSNLELCTEDCVIDFLQCKQFNISESAWVGNKTIYSNCYHLMPNHYLDLMHQKQIRFFPSQNYQKFTIGPVIDTATRILQGSFEAITKKAKIIQALTAGFDSRVLLAASKNHSQKINYFVDKMGILDDNQQDIKIPKLLAKRLGINLTVFNSTESPPGWFINILSHNVTGARALPKTRMIYGHFTRNESRININGNGGEICRNFFNKYGERKNIKRWSKDELAEILRYKNSPFVESELDLWNQSLIGIGDDVVNPLDLLYWEQRLGNWGAQYPAEQDIVIDEFSPFNNRLLIELLLSTPQISRIAPNFDIFRELIHNMWPEALSVPINPEKGNAVVNLVKKTLHPVIGIYRNIKKGE